MADQDFTINIRTTANTAGVQQIQAALQGLGAQVQSINAAGGGGGGEGGAGLLDKAAEKIEHGIFRTAVHAIGIGVVYEMVGALRETAKELEKVSDELDKQGAKLVSNAQLYSEATKFATSQADVIKIGSAAMKDMEEAHTKVVELQKQELGYWAQFSDFLNVQLFKNRGKTEGDYAATKRINEENAQGLEDASRRNVLDDIRAAKINEKRVANESYEETVKRVTGLMQEQQSLADTHLMQQDPGSYLSAAANVEKYRKQLEQLQEVHDKAEKDVDTRVSEAPPRVQGILGLEAEAKKALQRSDTLGAQQLQRNADMLKQNLTPKESAGLNKLETEIAKQNIILGQIRDAWQ